jgi:hypothetical protein
VNRRDAAMPSQFSWLYVHLCGCRLEMYANRDLTGQACPSCGAVLVNVRAHRYEARGGWARCIDGGTDTHAAVGSLRAQGGAA